MATNQRRMVIVGTGHRGTGTWGQEILYRNGVQGSYSLNACMPVEGCYVAFNGTRGRI